MYDVVALGELLIDFTTQSIDSDGYPTMAAHPGGAPANFLAAIAKFGGKAGMLGKVGTDTFGKLLTNTLRGAGIETKGLVAADDVFTTLAFVTLDENGDREFAFARKPGADTQLRWEEIDPAMLAESRVFHFGSLSCTDEPARTATQKAAAYARAHGRLVTYDPNYRANLWKNKEDAIAQMKAPLPLVDILKVSDEELPLLTGTTDCESGTAQLAQNGIRLIFVTLGANGVFYRFGEKTGHVAGVPCKVGDTNGAGDTFFGAALSKLCKEELDTLTVEKLESILAFANKAASITTSRHGAIPAMPTLAEVEG